VDGLLGTLQQLETELHQADTRRNKARLDELLHPEFEELGRSGRRYSREEILTEFSADMEYPQIVSMNFSVASIGEGIALLTYISAHKSQSGHLHRNTLRSSLWVLGDTGWKMRFHQGTPADGEPSDNG